VYRDSGLRMANVIRTFLNEDEFVRRMVIDVRDNPFSVVDRSAVPPAIPEWIENVIGFVDCCPKLIRTRDKRESLGIPNSPSEDFPRPTIEVVLIDRTSNGVAVGIFRICIRRGRDINI